MGKSRRSSRAGSISGVGCIRFCKWAYPVRGWRDSCVYWETAIVRDPCVYWETAIVRFLAYIGETAMAWNEKRRRGMRPRAAPRLILFTGFIPRCLQRFEEEARTGYPVCLHRGGSLSGWLKADGRFSGNDTGFQFIHTWFRVVVYLIQ